MGKLSCDECIRSHLSCDRRKPSCSSCSRKQRTCVYAVASITTPHNNPPSEDVSSSSLPPSHYLVLLQHQSQLIDQQRSLIERLRKHPPSLPAALRPSLSLLTPSATSFPISPSHLLAAPPRRDAYDRALNGLYCHATRLWDVHRDRDIVQAHFSALVARFIADHPTVMLTFAVYPSSSSPPVLQNASMAFFEHTQTTPQMLAECLTRSGCPFDPPPPHRPDHSLSRAVERFTIYDKRGHTFIYGSTLGPPSKSYSMSLFHDPNHSLWAVLFIITPTPFDPHRNDPVIVNATCDHCSKPLLPTIPRPAAPFLSPSPSSLPPPHVVDLLAPPNLPPSPVLLSPPDTLSPLDLNLFSDLTPFPFIPALASPQRQHSSPQRQLSSPQRQLSSPQRQLSSPQRQLSSPLHQKASSLPHEDCLFESFHFEDLPFDILS
ncbi:MAG: Zn(II)2Cys6 transcription factor domain-containing protein [archaeon]|nr:Zn(II)2Cys6 transcription factor domain-containing protein [archaeon]